ncbi:hypothetical protein ACWEO2_15840 [Nocardia sp. NPDC004278]
MRETALSAITVTVTPAAVMVGACAGHVCIAQVGKCQFEWPQSIRVCRKPSRPELPLVESCWYVLHLLRHGSVRARRGPVLILEPAFSHYRRATLPLP